MKDALCVIDQKILFGRHHERNVWLWLLRRLVL